LNKALKGPGSQTFCVKRERERGNADDGSAGAMELLQQLLLKGN